MALNVGQDFKKRWLDTPAAVRQTFIDDLSRICDLLKPSTDIQQWLDHDQRSAQLSQMKAEQAYADLKAQLIEEARIRKQLALEQILAEKREQQALYNQQLQLDEIRQFKEQTATLHALRQQIDDQIQSDTERYSKNPAQPAIDYANRQFVVADQQMLSELESVRLRLELEAEVWIDEAVQNFRQKLQAAAEDEITLILQNTHFSDSAVSTGT